MILLNFAIIKKQTWQAKEQSDEKHKTLCRQQRELMKAKDRRIRCLEKELRFLKKGYPEAEKILSEKFANLLGYTMDWNNPQTFNEKLQWMKLYDVTDDKTKLADKVLVRDWVKEKIGEKYLVPLIGVYDSFDDIDFDKLPKRFVMKANHGCAWNIIVDDKNTLDIKYAGKLFNEWMHTNYAFALFEMHYYGIEPKIIIEKNINTEGNMKAINDYKIMCINGEPEFIWIDEGRGTKEHTRTLYTTDWEKMDVEYDHPKSSQLHEKPESLDKMLELAKILSKEFTQVRVDFYEIEGKPYFGEMTFTLGSGLKKWSPLAFDRKLGEKIKLPIDNK